MRCPRIRTWVSTVTWTTFAGTRLMTTTPLPRKLGTTVCTPVHSHHTNTLDTVFSIRLPIKCSIENVAMRRT